MEIAISTKKYASSGRSSHMNSKWALQCDRGPCGTSKIIYGDTTPLFYLSSNLFHLVSYDWLNILLVSLCLRVLDYLDNASSLYAKLSKYSYHSSNFTSFVMATQFQPYVLTLN